MTFVAGDSVRARNELVEIRPGLWRAEWRIYLLTLRSTELFPPGRFTRFVIDGGPSDYIID